MAETTGPAGRKVWAEPEHKRRRSQGGSTSVVTEQSADGVSGSTDLSHTGGSNV